jgi:Gpi18-like mannosyltransferase
MTPRFVALLSAALLLRIVVATLPGYASDRDYFIDWAQTLAAHGPLAIYGQNVEPRVDYVPGYLYVLWAIGLIHAALGGGAATWRALLEFVPIVSDLALIALLYRATCRIASEPRAFALAAVVAFAPPLWIDSALFGQADALPIAFALLGLGAAIDGRLGSAWPALCAAVLIKPPSLVLAPVFAVLHVRARSMWRGLAVALVASLALAYVVTVPFTTQRAPAAVLGFLLERYTSGANKVPFVTWGAFTIYPLIAGFRTPDATTLGPLPYRTWGMIAVIVAVAAAAGSLNASVASTHVPRRRIAQIFGAASLSLLAFFLLATRMHERYMLPGLALAAPLAVEDRTTAIALASLALTFTINCAFTMLGFSGDGHHPLTLTIARICSAANLLAVVTLCQRQYARLHNDKTNDAAHGEGSRVRTRGETGGTPPRF